MTSAAWLPSDLLDPLPQPAQSQSVLCQSVSQSVCPPTPLCVSSLPSPLIFPDRISPYRPEAILKETPTAARGEQRCPSWSGDPESRVTVRSQAGMVFVDGTG